MPKQNTKLLGALTAIVGGYALVTGNSSGWILLLFGIAIYFIG
jgi:hypothetical protein